MTAKEKDAVKLLLLANAVKMFLQGTPPIDSRMRVRREDMMSCLSQMQSSPVEMECVAQVIAHFTHSEQLGNSARADYPEVYSRAESSILGNECFRDFLSAFADLLSESGDATAVERLKAAQAYVATSSGKSAVLHELTGGMSATGTVPGGIRSVPSQQGCMIPLVFFLGAIVTLAYSAAIIFIA